MFKFVIFICLIIGSLAVDRNIFKSCAQSGFCNRNRQIAEHVLNYGNESSWTVKSVQVHGPRLDIKIGRWSDVLSVVIEYLQSDALKLSVDPVSYSQRYKIPRGDIVLNESVSMTNVFESNEEDDEIYEISHTGLGVKITKDTFSITLISVTDGEIMKMNSENLFNYENGHSFLLSNIVKSIDYAKNNELWREPSFHGRHQDPQPKGPTSMGIDISFMQSKAIYGIPEHSTSLALKNTRGFNEHNSKVFSRTDPYRMFNSDVFEYELDSTMALYGSIPIMLGHNPQGSKHRSVGVFWNNPSETWVDVYDNSDENGRLTHWMSESGSMSMYIFAGKDLKELQMTIRDLIGAPQLPPSFALGYHQCRWNYKSVEDVIEVHDNFDKNALPLDVIWLDIEHTDGKRYMSWNPNNFADPEKMISSLSQTGRKLVTIVDPHLKTDPEWEVYKEIKDKSLAVKLKGGKIDFEGNCWPGKSVWTDYTNPEARKWWASLFSLDKYKKSSEDVYIWNDMNEPAVFDSIEVSMPRDNIHYGGVEHRDVHNLYGFYQHMSTFNGLLERSEGRKRPFVLSRSFYAGSQRYGAIWTGDNRAEWSHLEAASPMLLSLGVVGYHFAGADVGGFFGNPSSELLVRWYQAGAMQPFFRAHAHIETKRREPWLFGEVVMAQIRTALRLRYALLPLWYTAIEESSRTGIPPMRPMFLEYPDDEMLLEVDDQWMVSSSLLFKPITKSNQVSAQVILPKTDIWYDYFTMNVVNNSDEEGHLTENNLDLNRMLLYIRGGSVLPRKDVIRRSSNSMRFDPYTLLVALDQNYSAQGNLYIDDGDSYNYQEKKEYARVSFFANLQEDKKTLNFKFEVIGLTTNLSKNLLKVNRLILIQPSGHQEYPVNFSLEKTSNFELKF